MTVLRYKAFYIFNKILKHGCWQNNRIRVQSFIFMDYCFVLSALHINKSSKTASNIFCYLLLAVSDNFTPAHKYALHFLCNILVGK